MPESFGDRLAQAVRETRSAVCVGLDPRWHQLPEEVTQGVAADDLPAMSRATVDFCRGVIDAVVGRACILKPQAAFFEVLGPSGMAALGEVIRYGRQAGLLVLLDGKRGDIGSTAEGYAAAYLGAESAWQCDALTVNPYLGDDTLAPFVQRAHASRSGIFVLVKTSNPGSGFLQDQVAGHQPTVYQRVAEWVEGQNSQTPGQQPYGSVGAVVGATYPEQLAELRAAMPHTWLLIPGYGAQGGSAADVAAGFDSQGLGAIVNSSRGIIFAHAQQRYRHLAWQEAVARAADDMRAELSSVT